MVIFALRLSRCVCKPAAAYAVERRLCVSLSPCVFRLHNVYIHYSCNHGSGRGRRGSQGMQMEMHGNVCKRERKGKSLSQNK